MLTTRLMRPKHRGVWHVVHEVETKRLHDELQSLCGERFSERSCEHGRNKVATCSVCAKRDNPFDLSQNQEILFWKIATKMPDGKLAHDLVCRDLFYPFYGPNGQILVEEPRLTPKGDVLYRDIKTCVPWADSDGTFHKRRAMFRGKGVCGARLYALDSMTYTRLDQLMELHKDVNVNCIDCLADPHG